MKRIIYFIVAATVITSCKRKLSPTENLIDKFKPMIQGVWNNKEEMEEMARSKRVPERDTTQHYVSVMNIETEKINGDSITIGVGFNSGEGADLVFKFQAAPRPALVCGDRYELRYNVRNQDTVLYLYSKERDSIKATEFVKILQKFPRFDGVRDN